MDPEQEKVIYLRIARRAAIDGLIDLSAFASARAEGKAEDPRTMLYSSLSSVTSGTVSDVLAKLSKIDRSSLSENDRQLLDAASAIATEMAAVPAGMPAEGSDTVQSGPVEPEPLLPSLGCRLDRKRQPSPATCNARPLPRLKRKRGCQAEWSRPGPSTPPPTRPTP